MAGNVTVTSTTGSAYALLEQTWRPTLGLQANEEMRVANTFDDGNEGVSRFAGTLNVRKILRVSPTTVLYTAADAGTSLTYSNNTELNVQVFPKFAYGAVSLSQATLVRLLAAPELQKAYRDQITKGLATQIDSDAATQAASNTVTKGSSGQTFDKGFLLDGLGTLVGAVKELYEPGRAGWAYLHFHPNQLKYVLAIPEIVNAYIRGDGEKVVQKGWVWEAFGLSMSESGNVYTSGGIAYNFMHVKPSHILAYNAKPQFLEPQKFELVTRLIAFAEYGVKIIWDDYTVVMQTTSA